MMRKTHAAAGLMIGFAIGAQYAVPFEHTILLGFVSQSAALLPDLDLKLRLKHRGITHSLLALLIISAIGVWISFQIQDMKFWMSFSFGYASHLFLDLLTVQGIELFNPFSHRRIRVLKLRTGSRLDALIGALMLCGALYGFYWTLPFKIPA